MMQTPLYAIILLLSLSWTACVSGTLFGYKCDKIIISSSDLEKVVEAAKDASRLEQMDTITKSKLSNYYNGPPFTKPYLLWPVSPTTNNYAEAAKTPYRAVLDEYFEVFSVIIRNDNNVKECKMREILDESYNPYDYVCWGRHYLSTELRKVAGIACPGILSIAKKKFPARYDGPSFRGSGKQLYLFPLSDHRVVEQDNAPGSKFVVMNSACKVEGVVRKMAAPSSYAKCNGILSRSKHSHRHRPY